MEVHAAVAFMFSTTYHVANMKHLQIRNIPEELHRDLKERAARDGTTMSELVLRELPRIARRPSPQDVVNDVLRRERVDGPSAAELIGSGRAER